MLLRPDFGFTFARPGLMRTAAGAAVIAGTGAATARAMSRRSKRKVLEQPAAPAPGAGDALVARLQELASLHDAGDLTDDEFTRAKARLLA